MIFHGIKFQIKFLFQIQILVIMISRTVCTTLFTSKVLIIFPSQHRNKVELQVEDCDNRQDEETSKKINKHEMKGNEQEYKIMYRIILCRVPSNGVTRICGVTRIGNTSQHCNDCLGTFPIKHIDNFYFGDATVFEFIKSAAVNFESFP